MSRKIVTVEQTLRIVLGELDEEGYVINKAPLDIQLPKLTNQVFEELVKTVEEAKSKMSQRE